MKRYLKLPQKAFLFRYMEKRRSTATESSLPLMYSNKYQDCLKEQKAISLFLILKFSLLKVFLVVCF